MRESLLQDAFAHWLKKEGIPFIQPRRDKKSTVQTGWPDFSVFLPGARCCFIETKAEGGKVRPEQAECHERLRRCGHAVYVETTIERCIEVVEHERGYPSHSGPARTLVPRVVGEHIIYGNGIYELLPNGAPGNRVRTFKPGDERCYRKLA